MLMSFLSESHGSAEVLPAGSLQMQLVAAAEDKVMVCAFSADDLQHSRWQMDSRFLPRRKGGGCSPETRESTL